MLRRLASRWSSLAYQYRAPHTCSCPATQPTSTHTSSALGTSCFPLLPPRPRVVPVNHTTLPLLTCSTLERLGCTPQPATSASAQVVTHHGGTIALLLAGSFPVSFFFRCWLLLRHKCSALLPSTGAVQADKGRFHPRRALPPISSLRPAPFPLRRLVLFVQTHTCEFSPLFQVVEAFSRSAMIQRRPPSFYWRA